ncbi:MAG: agmatinase [Desulfurococcales archaeon]|nr:agmatinase [Desulfurococcales archaeon]
MSLYLIDNPEAFGGYRPRRANIAYSIIGFPFDSTSSYRAGQRFGPSSIRRASRYIEFNSLRSGIDLDEAGGLYDEGDVAVVYGDPKETVRRAIDVYKALLDEGRLPVMIGGEHLGTLGALASMRKLDPCIIWIDAHMDLRDDYLGCRYSHASVVRRLLERFGGRLKLFYLGVRGFSGEELRVAEEKGFEVTTSFDVRRLGPEMVSLRLKNFLADCKNYYISIDMDVFDPSYAPGVGNPEPEGLSPTIVLDIIWNIIDSRLVGFDVMEVSPQYDAGGITSVLAAKIVVEMASMHYVRSKGSI